MNLRSPWLLFGLGAGLAALFVSLGQWQLQRATFKDDLKHRFETTGAAHKITYAGDVQEWQRVSLRGIWLADRNVLLDNRMRHGQAGLEVLTPLQLEHDGGVVIVNRGWIAFHGNRAKLPNITTPGGPVEVKGLALAAVAPGFSLAKDRQDGPIWQKADLSSFARQLQRPVGAWLVRQEGMAPDTDPGANQGAIPAINLLDRNWPTPDFGADKHRAYALQWFAMAATALALCAWHGTKALRRAQAKPATHHIKRIHSS